MVRRYSDQMQRVDHETGLKPVTNTNGSDKIRRFIEINISVCFKNRIKPVDSKIFQPEWVSVTQDSE